jgi:hypothetical protein
MRGVGRAGDDATPAGPRAAPRTLATAAWAVALVVMALIAFSALARTGDVLGQLLADVPGPYGRRGLAGTAVYLLSSLAVIGLIGLAAARPRFRGPALPLLIVVLAIGIRAALAVVADAPLHGENAIIHQQAVGVLDGVCCFGHRPFGYPIVLAGAYALLGVGPGAIEALNIAFAVVTTLLVWDIGRVSWGRPVAAVAATAYALAPSQVLTALVPLTEPMYTMLVAGVVRAGIALERRPMLLAGAACAALVAAAQYVRATAAPLLLPLALLPWLAGWSVRRTLLRTVVIGGIFAVLLVPVIVYNLRSYGDLSISTSAYGGWSMYVGANREHGGQWNAEDAARLAGFPGDSWWERSDHAGGLVPDRVMEDPLGSVALLPSKFGTLWGSETYAASYALRERGITQEVHVGWLTTQLFWAPLSVLATLGMYAARRDPPAAALLIGMLITLVAATHLVLEVHSRYHAYLVPLFCLLAAVGVRQLVRWWRGSAAPPGV